jgi:hypothetical protein
VYAGVPAFAGRSVPHGICQLSLIGRGHSQRIGKAYPAMHYLSGTSLKVGCYDHGNAAAFLQPADFLAVLIWRGTTDKDATQHAFVQKGLYSGQIVIGAEVRDQELRDFFFGR